MYKRSYITIFLLISFFAMNIFAQSLTDQSDKPFSYPTILSEQVILWDNTNINAATSGIISTELGGLSMDSTLAITADDFVIPAGIEWTIDSILADGFLSSGSVNPDSIGIIIFDDAIFIIPLIMVNS